MDKNTEKVKRKVLELYHKGYTRKFLCKTFEITRYLFNKWLKEEYEKMFCVDRKKRAMYMYFVELDKKDFICKIFNITQAQLNSWIDEEYKKHDRKKIINIKSTGRQANKLRWVDNIFKNNKKSS